ncbi:hypothetical protein BD626DRAFT_547363 [Schizophyllum amplum]|uniref:CCDC174 alpha/beta GRSR domain-containing protein n=1 Tax=Schizophyllum amplum TaxID=97359 RepID=A0A550CJX1_9AGAR|nr:hypothetical protein BD626DRAFT_547363 [Auriculariopsis ampla]
MSKAKAKSFAASSLLDLKAELAQQEAEAKTRRAAGGKEYVAGGVKRPEKKSTAWLRANKGVKARAERDLQMEALDRPTLESSRARLEEKARMYDKLKRGQTAGLDTAQYDALLVDFDAKGYQAHSDDEDESLTIPRVPDEANDPIVEYVDDLGRTRSARKSEVPREFMFQFEEGGAEDSDEDIIIRNPDGFFPTYQPTAERVTQIEEEFAEQGRTEAHYDARGENRARGAAFYAFSADEEERKRQMEELRAARDETRTVRTEMGVTEVGVGEVEGMRVGDEEGDGKQKGKANEGSGMSKAMEKRKREREERQRMLEAKRRKVRGEPAPEEPVRAPASSNTVRDPLEALEAQSGVAKRDEADAFLAALETELRGM